MSVIGRYQKKGGFLLLLQLVETSGLSKQEKFLSLIEEDSKDWAKAVREKMLTFDKLLNASDEAIIEIFSDIKDLTFASATYGMPKEKWQRIQKLVNRPKIKKVLDQREIISPGDTEISNSIVQILQEVRKKADRDKRILDLINPKLRIEEDLENRLLGQSKDTVSARQEDSLSKKEPDTKVSDDVDDEIFRLRKKIKDLQNEMDRLKVQNHDLKARLERIQKLVS